MKLDALDHPKTFDFAARLGVELPTAIGHLELLWAFTGKKAATGNLGKWPDGAIARACYWMGAPAQFIQALQEAGFLDTHPVHRLVVHDWHVHASGWVRAKLKKLGLSFVSLENSSELSLEHTLDSSGKTSERSREPSLGLSIQAKRSEAKPSEAKPSEAKSQEGAPAAHPTDGRGGEAPKPKTATRLPADFSLTDARRLMAEAETLPAERTFAKFCDYWRAASGAKARKLDWDATWRNWCRTEADRSRGNYALNGAPKAATRLRTADEIEAEQILRGLQAGKTDAEILAEVGELTPAETVRRMREQYGAEH